MLRHKTQHLLHGEQHIFNIFGFDIAGDALAVVPIEVEFAVKMGDAASFEILKRRKNYVFVAPAFFERFPCQQRAFIYPAPEMPHRAFEKRLQAAQPHHEKS